MFSSQTSMPTCQSFAARCLNGYCPPCKLMLQARRGAGWAVTCQTTSGSPHAFDVRSAANKLYLPPCGFFSVFSSTPCASNSMCAQTNYGGSRCTQDNPYTAGIIAAGISMCQGCSAAQFFTGIAWYEPCAFVATLARYLADQCFAVLPDYYFNSQGLVSGKFSGGLATKSDGYIIEITKYFYS